MQSNSLPKYLVIGGAIVLVFLFFKNRYKRQIPAEIERTQQVAPAPVNQPLIIDSKKEQDQSQAQFLKQRTDYMKREKLGIQRIPLNSGGEVKLSVELRPKAIWCQAGDLDMMRRVIDDSEAKEIILSLESVKGDELAKPVRLSLAELYKGVKTTFALKGIAATSNENVFLSICSDRRKKNQCHGLKVVDLNQVNVSVQKLKKGNNLKGDYLFYFQNFFIAKGELVTYRSDDYSKKYRDEVEAYLKKEAVQVGNFDSNWKKGQAIRSTPIAVEGKVLVINLPHNDPKCRPH